GLPVYRAKVGHRKAPVIRRRINAIILARKRPRDAKSDRLLARTQKVADVLGEIMHQNKEIGA
ncbi:hypothetical protein, partial [Methylocella sp.]|uniref:hypothetical protein n=1 Tax=Methylocella sp. TaxID=1978226 RepID=UPI003C183C64